MREDIYDRMDQMVGLGLAHAMAENSYREARDVFMKALAMKGTKEGEE